MHAEYVNTFCVIFIIMKEYTYSMQDRYLKLYTKSKACMGACNPLILCMRSSAGIYQYLGNSRSVGMVFTNISH